MINRSALKRYALARVVELRPHLAGRFTEVSSDFILEVELELRKLVDKKLEQLPTKGKTI